MIIPESNKAIHIIWELEHEMLNPRNCGYTGMDMKTRLWEIKMRVDAAILKAPLYEGEPAFEDMYLMERIKKNV
jgi:hypothetical protein|tara:strand:- start:107 stop:328 length:222 start_codon:yes stop_codon:yes gene_type:complete